MMNLFALVGWWSELSGEQQVFWGISIVFSIMFMIQFVLSLLGFDSEGDLDTETDHGYHLDPDFSLLSWRSIIAFFTFFGWTGVLLLNSGTGTWTAVTFSSIAGFAAMFLVAYMLFSFSKLSQAGNIDLNEALDKVGEVYLTIPAEQHGTGKVHIEVQGSLRELEAETPGRNLPTGTKVRVIEVMGDNTLLVVDATELLSEEHI